MNINLTEHPNVVGQLYLCGNPDTISIEEIVTVVAGIFALLISGAYARVSE